MDSSRKSWMSRVGLVVIAAVLVEAITIFQYQRLRSIMQQEMDIRNSIILGSMAKEIGHVREITETTMQ